MKELSLKENCGTIWFAESGLWLCHCFLRQSMPVICDSCLKLVWILFCYVYSLSAICICIYIYTYVYIYTCIHIYICILSPLSLWATEIEKTWATSASQEPMLYGFASRAWRDKCCRYGPGHWRKLHWQCRSAAFPTLSLEFQGCRRKTWNRSWLAAVCCRSKVAKVLLLLKKKGIAMNLILAQLIYQENSTVFFWEPCDVAVDHSVGHFWCWIAHGHWTIPPRGKSCGIVLWSGTGNVMPHPSGTLDVDFDCGILDTPRLYHGCTIFLCFAGYFHEFRFQTVSFSDGSTAPVPSTWICHAGYARPGSPV